MEKASMAAPLRMEWAFVLCDTEHSASAARVKCGPMALKVPWSPAACRCKPRRTSGPYHDTEYATPRKITPHRGGGPSGRLRGSHATRSEERRVGKECRNR